MLFLLIKKREAESHEVLQKRILIFNVDALLFVL